MLAPDSFRPKLHKIVLKLLETNTMNMFPSSAHQPNKVFFNNKRHYKHHVYYHLEVGS